MTFLEQCALLSNAQQRQSAIQSILDEDDEMPEETLKDAILKTGATWPDKESYQAFLNLMGER